MRFKLQAASNKRQACDNMSCFFMHRNNYTGHTTKGEIYGCMDIKQNRKLTSLVQMEWHFHPHPREGRRSSSVKDYIWNGCLTSTASGSMTIRQEAAQDLRWKLRTSGAWFIRNLYLETRINSP
jgi:hypothetical protein